MAGKLKFDPIQRKFVRTVEDDSVYELVADKGVASGHASLDSTTKVPTAEMGTGTASSAKFLRGDRAWSNTIEGDITVNGTITCDSISSAGGGAGIASYIQNDEDDGTAYRLGVGIASPVEGPQLHVKKGAVGTRPAFIGADVAVFENDADENTVVNILAHRSKKSAVVYSDNDGRVRGSNAYDHATDAIQTYQDNTLRHEIKSTGHFLYDLPLVMEEQSAPATPDSGYSSVYTDSTGLLSFKNDAGVNYNTVKDVLESGGTKLTYGAVADGEYVKRSGSTLISAAIPNATPTTRGLDYQPIKQVGVCLEYATADTIKIKIQGSDGKAQLQFTNGTLWLTAQISADITLDITTTGANGRDTGSRTASTLWNVFAILNSSNGTVAGLFSLTNTPTTMPSGYDYYMLLGAIFDGNTVSTTNICRFLHDTATNSFWYEHNTTAGSPSGTVAASSSTATTITALTLAPRVPTWAKRVWISTYLTSNTIGRVYMFIGNAGNYALEIIPSVATANVDSGRLVNFPMLTPSSPNACVYFYWAATAPSTRAFSANAVAFAF